MADSERDNEYEVSILGDLQPAFDRWFAQLNPATQAGAIFMPTAFKAGYEVASEDMAQLRKDRKLYAYALREIQSLAGAPDASEACRNIIAVSRDALSNSDTEGEG